MCNIREELSPHLSPSHSNKTTLTRGTPRVSQFEPTLVSHPLVGRKSSYMKFLKVMQLMSFCNTR